MDTEEQSSKHPYEALVPDMVLNAVESAGYACSGSFLALNSYENRVYQVGIEDGPPIVVKFYRPGRWSNEAILEEHAFSWELADAEIPVVPPTRDENGETLSEFSGFRFAVYPRRGGHWPELENRDNLMWMGRFIARIHALGAVRPFRFRPTLSIDDMGMASYQYLLEKGFIPVELELAYRSLAEDILVQVRHAFDRCGPYPVIRLHGDCHPGNILWTDNGPHFVDFDDTRMGPAIQDLWMLLSGERQEMTIQMADILKGYEDFYTFNYNELHLIEALRTLRMLHYSAWLGKRWDDPAFPASFPWFNTNRYWEEQILALREQAALLDEAPINP